MSVEGKRVVQDSASLTNASLVEGPLIRGVSRRGCACMQYVRAAWRAAAEAKNAAVRSVYVHIVQLCCPMIALGVRHLNFVYRYTSPGCRYSALNLASDRLPVGVPVRSYRCTRGTQRSMPGDSQVLRLVSFTGSTVE